MGIGYTRCCKRQPTNPKEYGTPYACVLSSLLPLRPFKPSHPMRRTHLTQRSNRRAHQKNTESYGRMAIETNEFFSGGTAAQ